MTDTTLCNVYSCYHLQHSRLKRSMGGELGLGVGLLFAPDKFEFQTSLRHYGYSFMHENHSYLDNLPGFFLSCMESLDIYLFSYLIAGSTATF